MTDFELLGAITLFICVVLVPPAAWACVKIEHYLDDKAAEYENGD